MIARSVARRSCKPIARPVTEPGLQGESAPAAPNFVVHPQSQTGYDGFTVTFNAVATGNPAPTYQWQRSTNGGGTWSNISGATSSSYTTPSLQLINDGNQYRCVATNTEGSDTSNVATLTVGSAAVPSFSDQPDNTTANEGETATFTVVAAGTPTPTLQWQRNTGSGWLDISGATASSYTTPTLVAGNDGDQYRCQASNLAGTTTSNTATLTVTPLAAPVITSQPSDTSASEGATATFSVTATGNPSPTYQWQLNTGSGWSNISGATGTSFTTPTLVSGDDQNLYRVVVTNSQGSATSNAALLTVTPSLGGNYLRPASTDRYRRPGGVDLYTRP